MPSAQKRSAFRVPVEFDVGYAVDGRSARRTGKANDLSAGGLRLVVDEDLVKHSMLTLDFMLPDAFLAQMTVEKELYEQSPFGLRPQIVRVQPPRFAPMSVRGKVLPTSFNVRTRTFSHGIAFVDIDASTQEELRRFIHLWQVHHLRARRG